MTQIIKPVSQNMCPSGSHSSYQSVIRLKSRKNATTVVVVVVVVSTVSQYRSIPLHYTTGCVYNDNNRRVHLTFPTHSWNVVEPYVPSFLVPNSDYRGQWKAHGKRHGKKPPKSEFEPRKLKKLGQD